MSANTSCSEDHVVRGTSTRRRSVSTPSCVAPKRARLTYTVDDDFYAEGLKWVKAHRARALDVGEKLDIILLHLHLRHEAWEQSKLPGRPKKIKFANEVARILRRDKNLCVSVWKNFVAERELSSAPTSTARGRKLPRIPRSMELRLALRNWLGERNRQGQRTVARDVMRWMVDARVLPHWILDDSKGRETAERAVRRYLTSSGFRRGSVAGKQTYKEKERVIRLRDLFVDKMLKMKDSHRIVYMDESYIHHHYSAHNDSIYDPTDPEPTERKRGYKGSRYCFVGAIVSRNPSVSAGQGTLVDEAHFLLDTLDIFRGGKQKKDYHAMFDHEYFAGWMKKLLAALEKLNIRQTVIVMDNAKYHTVLPDAIPRKSWKKAKLLQYCNDNGMAVEPTDSRATIWESIAPRVASAQPLIVEMARSAGHDVLFSPPHYSDLQPIETVWAIVKGRVGRQYDNSTNMSEVQERLRKAFTELSSHEVEGCIKKAQQALEALGSGKDDDEKVSDEEGEELDVSDSQEDADYDDYDDYDDEGVGDDQVTAAEATEVVD